MNKKNILVVGLIAIVNALGYGIIIPVLYSYSHNLGLNDFQNGLLFSTFSIFQFVSTPIIGRLSDKYGRKPLLLISLAGTLISFVMMATAKNYWWLFLARGLDGLTAGNITVVQAVISDSTHADQRAKMFGLLGAAFGFGFIFGPAISAVSLKYGIATPFWVASGVTFVAIITTLLFLKETNNHKSEVKGKPFFDVRHLISAITNNKIGRLLIISLLYSFAFSLYIYAYQPFSVKSLGLEPSFIASMFTYLGIIGLVSQGFVLPKMIKNAKEKFLLTGSLFVLAVAFFGLSVFNGLLAWILITGIIGFSNVFVAPMIQSLVSKAADSSSQGSILGINASYVSLGMIFGPIVGGLVSTVKLTWPFVIAFVVCFVCLLVSVGISEQTKNKIHAF